MHPIIRTRKGTPLAGGAPFEKAMGERLLLLGRLFAALLLENRGRFEGKRSGSSDLHGSASLGITTRTSRTSLHLKRTKPDQLNLVATLYSSGDGIQHSAKSSFGALLGSAFTKLGLNLLYKLSLVHRASW